MSKAVVLMQNFVMSQPIIIYNKENQEIKKIQTTMSELNNVLINAIDEFKLSEIEFIGSKNFSSRFIERLKEMEMTKYNVNKVKITAKNREE